jgi:hypothetical protein
MDLPGMWTHADLSGGWADSENVAPGNEKPVPVEVKMVVWVKRQGWEAEYGGVNDLTANYNFEEAVQDWFVDEVETIRDQGEWPNVTEVTQ